MPLSPNQQLDEFQILRPLGTGGFGAVYLAQDTLLNRPVAIKELIAPRAADNEAFQRFIQEARTAGSLNHPNIVTVYGLRVKGEVYYLILEYVSGGSLRDRLKRDGKVKMSQAVQIAAEVADALAAVHDKGIIHRDIKPENILLTEDSRAKVADFGIAHVPKQAGGLSLTQTGFQPGTFLYMSPEQIRGEGLTAASDVYQVAVVLHEMLTGSHYFDPEALLKQAMLELRATNPEAPAVQARWMMLVSDAIGKHPNIAYPEQRELSQLQEKILSSNAIHRSSMRKFCQDLHTLIVETSGQNLLKENQNAQGIHQSPALKNRINSLTTSSQGITRQKPSFSFLWLIAGIVLVVIAIGFISNLASLSFTSPSSTLTNYSDTSTPKSTQFTTSTKLPSNTPSLTPRPTNTPIPTATFKPISSSNLANIRPLKILQGKAVAIEAVNGYFFDMQTLETWGVNVNCLKQGHPCSLSLNSKLLANASDFSVDIWDYQHKNKIKSLDIVYKDVAISPDGKLLAIARYTGWEKPDIGMALLDVNTGKVLHSFEIIGTHDALGFTPDGKTIALAGCNQYVFLQGCNSGEIILWGVSDGKLLKRFTLKNDVSSLAFNQKGNIMASASKDSLDIKIWDLETGKSIRTITDKGDDQNLRRLIALNPEGEILISVYSDYDKILGTTTGHLLFWDVQTGKQLYDLDTGEYKWGISGIAFNVDGSIIALSEFNAIDLAASTVKLWSVYP
jgi:serine/threonine protein kinase